MSILGGTLNDVLDEPISDLDNKDQHWSIHESGGPITAFQPVALVNGLVVAADRSIPAHCNRVIGIALNSTAGPGGTIQVATQGIVTNIGWTFTTGERLWVGLNGAIETTLPTSGFVNGIGHAIELTKMEITLTRNSINRS